MRLLHTTQRKAIAMIELIFAIVVMGIVMLSAPLMLSTATQSSNVAFQQESIAIVASHANTLMTYAWDEKNTNSYKIEYGDLKEKVLAVSASGDTELTPSLGNVSRQHDTNSSSAQTTFGIPDANVTLPILSAELNEDDIDDFHGQNTSLTIANDTTTSAVSYEDNYMDIQINLVTDISYWDDTAIYIDCGSTAGCDFSRVYDGTEDVGSSTNIKRITVTLTSSNVDDKTIILRSFMANIGGAKPEQESGF